MRKALGLAVVAATMVAAPVQAAEWWFITAGHNQDVYFADADSLASSGDTRQLWYAMAYKNAIQGIKFTKAFAKIDCYRRTYTSLSYINYNQGGNVIDTGTIRNPTETPIAPETIVDGLREFACTPQASWKMIHEAHKISEPPEQYAKQVQARMEAAQ